MLKKIIAIALTALLLVFSGCTSSPTQTPESTIPPGTITVSELSDYTIIYPADYTEYRMQEVNLLCDVIKNITGKAPAVADDKSEPAEKEIILGSSKRENAFSEEINAFTSGLDYIIGINDDKIVLGGNNFYADMRAIYDFMNNYLGYNDIEDKYTEAVKPIVGVNTYIYQQPLLRILGSNFSVSPYTEQYAVRDMHDAYFNMTLIDAGLYSEEQMRDYVKWCARYEIFIIMRSIAYTDVYYDCPVIWGHCITDEPTLENFEAVSLGCKEYTEKYSQYGWKPYVNFVDIFASHDEESYNTYCEAYDKYFGDLFAFSYDKYFGDMSNRDRNILGTMGNSREQALKHGQEFWHYIEAFNLTNGKKKADKMFRTQSYISLCFGADCIEYFQYGDVSDNYTSEGDWSKGSLINCDYSKNDYYYMAQSLNKELLKISEMCLPYENVGAYTIVQKDDIDYFADLNNPYDFSDVITDFESVIYKDSYLIGCFDKKDGDGHAFMLVDIEPLDNSPYNKTIAFPVKIKINGNDVKFYRDGELQEVEKDDDGYYILNTGNGYCWFVTVD